MSVSLELLVEEPSAEAALRILLPRICPGLTFAIHVFQGKQSLLRKLPARLAGYSKWAATERRIIVVLVDKDTDDCMKLKATLEGMASAAGMRTPRTTPGGRRPTMLTRIAIEELEAWFFGDIAALRATYPRIPDSLGTKAPFRVPDEIAGGTSEALERTLQKYGYHKAGMPKIANATAVASHMDVEANTSTSFIRFRDGIRAVTAKEVASDAPSH